MANTNTMTLTDKVTNHTLALIETNSVMLKMVKRHLDFAGNLKYGSTIRVPKSIYLQTGSGLSIASTINDIEQGDVSITLDQHVNLSIKIDRRQLAEEFVDETTRNISESAARTIVQRLETDIMDVAYKNTYHMVNAGTPNTAPSTVLEVAQGDVLMDENGIPNDMERMFVISPSAMAVLGSALQTVFVNRIAEKAIEKAYVGEMAGLTLHKSVNVPEHLNGRHTTGATPLITVAGQSVTHVSTLSGLSSQTILTDGWDGVASTLTRGSSFTIDDVYRVKGNAGKEATGELQVFVVNSDVTSTGAGDMTMNISPAIITDGPYQTVSTPVDLGGPGVAGPDAGAPINMIGTELASQSQGLLFVKDALCVAFGSFAAFEGGSVESTTANLNGVSLTVSKFADGTEFTNICRWDLLYGIAVLNSHFIARYSAA